MHQRRAAAAPAGQPRRDPSLLVSVLLLVGFTLLYVWLDSVDRKYMAELTADAVIHRLRIAGSGGI